MLSPEASKEAIEPLNWLIGKWRSVSANGKYPTIKSFTYNEELEFTFSGQPLLNYTSRTFHPVKKTAMHLESGFLRLQLNTKHVALISSHNLGITTIEEGDIVNQSLNLKSKRIAAMSFSAGPEVKSIERSYAVDSSGRLTLTVQMATSKTTSAEHLKIVYEKY